MKDLWVCPKCGGDASARIWCRIGDSYSSGECDVLDCRSCGAVSNKHETRKKSEMSDTFSVCGLCKHYAPIAVKPGTGTCLPRGVMTDLTRACERFEPVVPVDHQPIIKVEPAEFTPAPTYESVQAQIEEHHAALWLQKKHAWLFEDGKKKPVEQWKHEGKPEWPHHLTMLLSRKRALSVIALLASMLEHSDADEPIEISLVGELRQDEDEVSDGCQLRKAGAK